MRTSEWIQIGFAIVLAAAAWIQPFFGRPLPVRRRVNITLFALVPLVAVMLARATASFLPPLYVSTLRDWLTVALFLVPYWQTGQFFQTPNHRIEERLLAFDRWLMPRTAGTSGTSRTGVGLILEIAYLFCATRWAPLGCCSPLNARRPAQPRRQVPGRWFSSSPISVTKSRRLCPRPAPRPRGQPAKPRANR